MLKILRKKGIAKKILWVLAGMITVSFVFWGFSSSLTQQNSVRHAGRIYGRNVSLEEFQKAFLHTRNQAIMRYGENFYKIHDFLDLNSETWERLILLHEARRRRIQIADQDVVDVIRGLSFFQRNGWFDEALYHQIVQHVFRCRPREFEEGIRQSLIFQKLYDQETALVRVSDNELLETYRKQHEQIQVDYILFLFTDYKENISVSDEEAEIYYTQNRNALKMPSTINISYLSLEYPADASEEQKERINEKAMNIAMDINESAWSLAKVAEKHGLSLRTSGFFSQDQIKPELQWPLEIFQRALLLPKGEIAGPIDTLKGYYFLELKEKRDSYIPEFNEVREKARKAVVLQKARKKTLEAAKKTKDFIQESLKENIDQKFSILAQSLGKESERTSFFTRGQYLPQIGPSAQFHETAFTLNNQNPISDIVETAKGYMLLSFVDFIPIDEEKYQEEKDSLRQKLLAQKRDNQFNSFVERLRMQANLTDNLKKLNTADSL